MSGQATPATVALRRLAIVHTLHAYPVDEPAGAGYAATAAGAGYGAAAAAALGVPENQLFKTLVASVDGALVCAVVPVSGHLDLKALARVVGGKRATLAEPAAAERVTGYVVGGISPFGQRSRLPVVLDESIERFDAVFVSAGRRGLQVRLAPIDVRRATSATVAAISTG